MARPPSADSILRNAKKGSRIVETHANIGTEIILPNNSGDHTKGIKRDTPLNDFDLVNKKYVDDEIVDKAWLKSTNQTGLTGNKTGSYYLDTTGNIDVGTLTLSGNDITDATSVIDMGANELRFDVDDGSIGLGSTADSDAVGMRIGGNKTQTFQKDFNCIFTQTIMLNPDGGDNFRGFITNVALNATVSGSGTVDTLVGNFANPATLPNFSGTITDVKAYHGAVTLFEGTITNYYGMELLTPLTPTNNATIGTAYGLKINDMTDSQITTGYAIKTGTGLHEFGDDTYWVDEGSGLLFGQIYEEDGSSTLALAAQDTFYQVTAFSANGESNSCTPDHTNDHITVSKAGKYLVTVNISFSQTTAVSIEYDFHIQTNNGANDFPCVSAHRDTAGSSVVGNCSCTGIIDLAANDTVELWVERLSGGAVSRTITIPQCSITITQIGGT